MSKFEQQATPTQMAGRAIEGAATIGTFGAGQPAGFAGKVALNSGLGGVVGAAQGMEEGKTPKEIASQAALGAAGGALIPVAGKAIEMTKNGLTEVLPKSLIKAYFPSEKDISEHLIKNTKLGFTKTMLSNAKDNVGSLSKEINEILESNPDIFIDKNKLLKSVAQSYGQTGGGGTIKSSEVIKLIQRIAPDSKGLLLRDSLSLKDANRLRMAIDKALGDRFFLAKHSPFAKEVAGNFNSFLRETVKSNAPKTIPIFDELSKEINVRNALQKSIKKFGRVNLRDLISIVTGATAGATQGVFGAMAGAAGGVVGERVLTSPSVGLGVAKGLSQLGRVSIPKAGKDIVRFGVMKAISQ